jgi:hypothetical protein
MWWLRKRARDPRNAIMDAALEIGPNWRRPVAELASERCPSLDEQDRIAISAEVEAARNDVEEWVAARWDAVVGHWSRQVTEMARQWVAERFPWMSPGNVQRVVNQATYYAWHG